MVSLTPYNAGHNQANVTAITAAYMAASIKYFMVFNQGCPNQML